MQTVTRLTQLFRPHHYQLTLDTNREAKTFIGTVTIEGESFNDGFLRVHAKDLLIETVIVDGHDASYRLDINDELEIRHEDMIAGKHIVVIGYSGVLNDQMHGMYPCYFEHDGVKKQLIATQFESHHAREVFPCVDEPDAKATYDVTLLTEPGITVLGNMPVIRQVADGDRLATTFATTPKMSSYLLAWVYGELHKKSGTTKSGVEVNIWATPAQPTNSLDFALDIAVRTIDFFDEYFGVAYPLPKSDHVALPDFSSGAMENWGLITYREVALLAEPGTVSISSKHRVAAVIAHELSHQWFGNLVTMKWWNNLWLNESFANLMEYVALDALHPEWNIWLDFAGYETVASLRRDAIDGVQSVQVDVNHPDEISTLFDPAIVYAKGSRLLQMLGHYIGPEDFRAGLQHYFANHAYKNTDETDLWSALSATSGKDITSFMNSWITQPGFPVVHVTQNSLSQEQFFVGPHQPTNALWPIPLFSNDSSLPIVLDERELSLSIPSGTRLNIGNTAHFISHYEPILLAALVEAAATGELGAIDRLQLLHEQTLLSRGGVTPSAALIPLLDAYKEETTESVWDIIAVTIGELKKFVEDDEPSEAALRTLAGTIARSQFERLGWNMRDDESETDTKLRSTILSLMLYSQDPDVIAYAKKLYTNNEVTALDPEQRSLIIGTVVRHADSSKIAEDLLQLHAATSSGELQRDICAGLTSTRDPELISTLLSNLTDPNKIRSQDVAHWFVYLIRNRYSRDMAWQWMVDNWKWIEEVFGGDKSFDDYPRYSASGLVTREQLHAYIEFFTPLKEVPALSRVISIGISEIEGRVELIERDRDAVRKTLLER